MNAPNQFRSRIGGFRARKAVYWCLQCNEPANRHAMKGKAKVVLCANCGSKGHYFPSTGEMHRYAHLRMLQNAGEISSLRLQPAFPIDINGIRVCTYRADFEYLDRAGNRIIEDYKGSKDHVDQSSALRRKLAQAMYGVNITIVEK